MYETTVIINPSIEDHQIDAILKNIEEMISKNGGTVTSLQRWGRKRLSYPINKRNNGYYAHFEFEINGNVIADIERNFEYDDNIMRYLTIRLDAKMQEAKERQKIKPRDTAEAINELEELDIIEPDDELDVEDESGEEKPTS